MKILIAASNMVHIKNFHQPYIERFRSLGHSVYVMARGEGADFDIPFEKKSLSIANYKLSRRIREILKRESFDVIYLHTSLASFWVRMALRGMKKRPYVVNTVHGYLFGKSSGRLHNTVYLFCEKLLRKQTDEIVVMNREDYVIATENRLCLGRVTSIDGMGVKFKENVGAPLRWENGKKNLVFVGEISKRKNQMFLVEAMKHLPKCALTLVGDGDCRGEIERYVKEAGLEESVRVTGFTSNAYEYIKGCDLYVSASSIEGLPFNIMEAMRMGKRIIASDIKGHCDLLPSEQLYQLGDMDGYVALVEKFLDGKGAEYDTEKYSLGAVLDKNVALYLSFLGDTSSENGGDI